MSKEKTTNKCFVIMPISDPEGYEPGHFKCVYDDIFKPAIEEAGFEPKRADDDGSSSMIQVNIIKDIIESPMAICDLSTRNPNVLFELGIRQAFDLPVVLVQEERTPRIFDINTINTIDYRKSLKYREVIEDRGKISKAIKDTKDNTTGVNSIIRLLEIGKAEMNGKKTSSDMDDIKMILLALSNQIRDLEKKNQMFNDDFAGDNLEKYVRKLNVYINQASKQTDKNELNKILYSIKRMIEIIKNDTALSKGQKLTLETEYVELAETIQNKLIKWE